MTKKPKQKIKFFQRKLSKAWARIHRNTIHATEKGGAPYAPLRAVEDMVRARRKLSEVQREVRGQETKRLRQPSPPPNEVTILRIEWEPDYPHAGGWCVHGVYETTSLALDEVERIKGMPGNMMKSYNFNSHEVKTK